jgi:hypothetical protein
VSKNGDAQVGNDLEDYEVDAMHGHINVDGTIVGILLDRVVFFGLSYV